MATNASLLECPVCIELMRGPIYQCVGGHSLCQQCRLQLPSPKKCPLCRGNMTDVRSILLENMVELEVQKRTELMNARPAEVQVTPKTTKMYCRFKSDGCKYVLNKNDYESHIEECIYRDLLCPYSAFNNSCFWIGKFSMLKNHFSSKHLDSILSVDHEYEMPNFSSITGIVRLIVLDKLNFILHWKTDTMNNNHFIAVQNIGTKIYAQNWNYEIKFCKVNEPRCSFTFTNVCRSDSMQITEIFQNKHCIVIPKSVFNEFGTGLKFKVLLQKNEPAKVKSHKGTKDASNTSSRGLTLP